jgi:hypothetical protein
MDTEQLKLILELVSNTTGDAKQVAVAWLIIQALGPIVTLLGWCGFCILIGKCFFAIRDTSLTNNDNHISMTQIGQIVQTESEARNARCRDIKNGVVLDRHEIIERVREAFKGKNQ